MKIRSHQVIYFEYQLLLDGQQVQRSGPIAVLTHFAPHLPKGLEAALTGRSPGTYPHQVPPEEAYGPYDPSKRLEVPIADLPEPPRLGGGYAGEGPDGEPWLYRVVALQGAQAVLDANHEWAGKTLEYRFTIFKVRPAEPEEVAHGHVHGEGGVEH